MGLIGEARAGNYFSYHFDLRGSTIALSAASGQVTERFQYSPYGSLMYGDASKTPFLFNGLYGVMSDSNNLYYMRARFYSPEIRRFVNRDVLLGGVAEGQTLNRFAFVTGRPVSFVDPFGLKTIIIFVDDYSFSKHVNTGHTVIYLDNILDEPILYDPNGSYPGTSIHGRLVIGTVGYFSGEEADIALYLDWAKEIAPEGDGYGELFIFFTSPEEELEIAKKIKGTRENFYQDFLGDPAGGYCAERVYTSIKGIGPFKDIYISEFLLRVTPKRLFDELNSLPDVRRSHGYRK